MIKTLLHLVYSFGKIGLISLGGGNSMLKLLEYEAVDYRHWVENKEFVDMLASSFLFPGLTGVKLSALIGYKAAGFWGAVFAIISLNLPGLMMAMLGYQWLAAHKGPRILNLMTAIQYGAAILLAAATFSLMQSAISTRFSISIALLSALFFLALVFGNVSPFYGFMLFIGLCFLALS